MMVTPHDEDWFFVTLQPDHARVAGYLAAHWGNERFDLPEPFASVVLAAQEHDHGWWRWECKPTLDPEGMPIDYHGGTLQILGQRRLDLYADWIDDLAAVDAYAALLVSLHLSGLLNGGFGKVPFHPDLTADPRVATHLERQARVRAELRNVLSGAAELAPYLAEAWLDHNFMLIEAVDQVAQLLCNRYPLTNMVRRKPTLQLGGLAVPFGVGAGTTGVTVTVEDTHTAVIDPYPFDEPLSIAFEGRLLPRKPYGDRAAFLRAFYRAPRVNVNYELHGKD